ncbi:cytosine permease [Anaeromicrobium sediminis]|uniref:Cytosine permease n=1 Tax=Anaeromicrobium sediminis TaxID=1478221 RepID=A0A267MKG2_9FIRM|nr:cytosine permease [Anaeromicrobium sediminis]PAB60069.1 cytosine permease [Anaeromicrobium sediminis]
MSIEEKSVAHDDYALEPVPESARRGLISMSTVMLGFTFFAASMWTGGTLGMGFRLWPDLILVITLGNLILGVYGAFLGYAAAKTNLSTHILARYAFGIKGSKLPSFMLAFTQIGWFGVGVAMFAYPINKFTGVSIIPLIIIGGILMTATVVIGFKAIEWISKIAVPAIILLGCMSVGKAIISGGGLQSLLAVQPEQKLTVAVGTALTVGSFISGATLTPDFVRFAKTKQVGVQATIIGFTFGNSLMFLFGAIGAIATGLSDISEVLAAQGLLGAGIALLALNIWTTNDNALYASGLGLANITGLKRKHLTIVAGTVGTVFSIFLYNNFVGWLTFLSVSLPPIGGIIIADFYLRCKREYPSPKEYEFKQVNWAAMIAWIVAIIASSISPEAGIFSITPLNAIITAIVVHVIAYDFIYGKTVETETHIK